MTALYVLIDPEHCAGRDPLWVAEQALLGGCEALQLRSKAQTDRERLSLARALRSLTRAHGVPFWINDRLDLALLCEADGLHLGQTDFPAAEVRKLSGKLLLGLSTHSLAQAEAAVDAGVDILGFGPVFPTASKLNPDPEVGLAGLSSVLGRVQKPLVAIGGIQASNVAQVAALKPAYVAVISAVCGADSPQDAARALVKAL